MTFYRKNDVIYLIEKNEDESNDVFIDRCNFIVSQNPKNDKEYDKIILYSLLYTNVKYLGCKYENVIMEELNKMLDNDVKINL